MLFYPIILLIDYCILYIKNIVWTNDITVRKRYTCYLTNCDIKIVKQVYRCPHARSLLVKWQEPRVKVLHRKWNNISPFAGTDYTKVPCVTTEPYIGVYFTQVSVIATQSNCMSLEYSPRNIIFTSYVIIIMPRLYKHNPFTYKL